MTATGTGAADPSGSADAFGPPWVLQSDGLLFRRGARVLVLDPTDRVLMVRGHDVDQPERSWWFTIGGGIDPGEDARTAAVREAREETGLRLDPVELVGPVFRRSAIFDFYARRCRQDEEIFLARVDGVDVADLDSSAWTAVEQETIDELRWWDLDELERVDIEVFPEGLPGLLRPILSGWDGVTRDLGTGIA